MFRPTALLVLPAERTERNTERASIVAADAIYKGKVERQGPERRVAGGQLKRWSVSAIRDVQKNPSGWLGSAILLLASQNLTHRNLAKTRSFAGAYSIPMSLTAKDSGEFDRTPPSITDCKCTTRTHLTMTVSVGTHADCQSPATLGDATDSHLVPHRQQECGQQRYRRELEKSGLKPLLERDYADRLQYEELIP